MKHLPYVFVAQTFGVFCGAILGSQRTREVAEVLLAKNQALQAAGLPSLPGPTHWDLMTGSGPAAAGAVFFGLSLGLGWGTLFGIWGWAWSAAPLWARKWAPWAALGVPIWAVGAGDPTLGAALLVIAGAAVAVSFGFRPLRPRTAAWYAILSLLVLAGLIPWSRAPEGPFSRLRDRYLLSNPVGLALNHYYYRWTLYPAEILKPLAAKTQPTASASGGVAPEMWESFCEQALRQTVLCLETDWAEADFRVEQTQEGLVLALRDRRTSWPRERKDQTSAWRDFSRATDSARPLRKTTALGLLVGCPLALCWSIAALAKRAASGLPGAKARRAGAAAFAGLCACLLWVASHPSPELAAVRKAAWEGHALNVATLERFLRSPLPAERFYAAHKAGELGPAALPLLLDGITDPVVNVRYAAAQSLGKIGGEQARTVLLGILRSPEEWYVKERAYAALWRMGWRPRAP